MPRALTLRLSCVTRPSRLVVVPSFSPKAAAGRTTSQRCNEGDIVVSTAIIFGTAARAWRTRCESGTSFIGSAPTRTKQLISPAIADCRIELVDPVTNPVSTAPRILPRRTTGRTVACGAMASTASRAAIVNESSSAKFARPTTTTTEPLAI